MDICPLGDAFDDETREAWATAYGVLASVMTTAAEEVGAEPGAAVTAAA